MTSRSALRRSYALHRRWVINGIEQEVSSALDLVRRVAQGAELAGSKKGYAVLCKVLGSKNPLVGTLELLDIEEIVDRSSDRTIVAFPIGRVGL